MQSQSTSPALARAIDYLDAVKVASGGDHTPYGMVMRDLYAYRADETRRYYIVDADDLVSLTRYILDEQRMGYSEWCADTKAIEMPAWWTPEQRFAWSVNASDDRECERLPGVTTFATAKEARAAKRNWGSAPDALTTLYVERITANLATGEEVEA